METFSRQKKITGKYILQFFYFLPLRKFKGPFWGKKDLYKIRQGQELFKSLGFFLIALIIEFLKRLFK